MACALERQRKSEREGEDDGALENAELPRRGGS